MSFQHNGKYLLTIAILLLLLPAAHAQQLIPFSGTDDAAVEQLFYWPEAQATAVAIRFSGTLQTPEGPYSSAGESDFLLALQHDDGRLQPFWQGGGPQNDHINGMAASPDGQLYVCGSFWQQASVGTRTLVSNSNPKAVFLLQTDSSGTINWTKTIEGGQLKEVHAIAVDLDGNVSIAGYFSDALHIQGDTLLQARGQTDAFLLNFSPGGTIRWAQQLGAHGDSRARTLAVDSEGNWFVGGIYNDTLAVADTSLIANTRDQDLFIASFTPEGTYRWVRRAGGVHDDELRAMTIDEHNNLYLTGYLVGVMKLNDSLSIQSMDGNADFYLISYHPEGHLRWGRALPGTMLQEANAITYVRALQEVVLTGIFIGELDYDERTISSSPLFNGFIAGFQAADGRSTRLEKATTAGYILPAAICSTPNGIVLGATYNTAITIGSASLPLPATYNGLLVLPGLVSSTTPIQRIPFRIFPNPATDWIQVETPVQTSLQLLDGQGRIIRQYEQIPGRIDIHQLAAGVYFLRPGIGPAYRFIVR